MKKGKFIFFVIMSIFLSKVFAVEIDFPVADTIKAEWNENWFFERSSSEYNHGMARVATIFDILTYDWRIRERFEENKLLKTYRLLGIKDEDMDFHYDMDFNLPVFGINQAAFSLAAKEVTYNGQKKNLVFVVVRGTTNEASEWMSNFEFEGGEENGDFIHGGFADCTEQVYNALLLFLIEKNIDPRNSSFFLTGHSRGGAISNLLGKKMSEQKIFNKKNIFVYTTSCPNVVQTKRDNLEDDYDFIWNLINGEDFFPSLPPCRGEWYYKKYGHSKILVNAWNCERDKYEQIYYPKMNEYFNRFFGKNYKPLRTGPFLQTQVARLLTGVYKTSDKYFNGLLRVPKIVKSVIKSSYPDTVVVPNKIAQSEFGKNNFYESVDFSEIVFQAQTGNPYYPSAEEYLTDEKPEDGFWFGLVEKMVSSSTNVLSDAIEYTHIPETTLSYIMALDEDEAFSEMGFTQIVFDGYYDCAIFDKDENLLAQIIDGVVQYEKTKRPIATFPFFGKQCVVGFPGNEEFTVVINKESLIPTPVSIQLEIYSSEGILLETEKKEIIAPNFAGAVKFVAGKNLLENKKIEYEKLSGAEKKSLVKKGCINQSEKLFVKGELAYDLDNQLHLGVTVGNKNIYASLFTMQPTNNFASIFELSPGIGHKNDLFGNLIFSTELYSRFVYNFSDVNDAWNIVPSAVISLSFQPRNRTEFFVSGIFDFNIVGFNDNVFDSRIRKNVLGKINCGDKLNIIPTINFGMRF